MTLVDTSVWIQFMRGDPDAADLESMLADRQVCCHPWIIGELALGTLGKKREQILGDLGKLLSLPVISSSEVRFMIKTHSLAGSGIGWVDAQLISSALAAGVSLWSMDKKMSSVISSMRS